MIVKLLIQFVAVSAISNAELKRPPSKAMERLPGIWSAVLWRASNNTGFMDSDRLTEGLVRQFFTEVFVRTVQEQEPLLGAVLDPLWLWPMEDSVKEGVFETDFKVCNIHMHNFKSANLVDVKVLRNPILDTMAVRLIFRLPILWITGRYRLTRSLLMGFIPVKGRRGDFNIDVKDVTVGVIISLRSTIQEEISMDDYEVAIHWKDIDVKFENVAGRFSTVAHLTLNQLGLGRTIVAKEKENILSQLKNYSLALLNCGLKHPAKGVELCMRDWWGTQGWPWPWKYPICDA